MKAPVKLMSVVLVGVVAAMFVVIGSDDSNAKDSSCKTAGATKVVAGKTYTCKKVGKKLIWKIAAASAGTASSSANVAGGARSYAPQNFTTVLAKTYSGLPSSTTSLVNTKRYMLSDGSSNYLTFGAGNSNGVSPAKAIQLPSSSTYNDYLDRLVQLVSPSNTTSDFRMDSHLNANYSLDADPAGNLRFTNNWGVKTSNGQASVPAGMGYLLFTYDPNSRLVTAKQRFTLNPTNFSHSPDPAFAQAGYFVNASAGSFTLVSSRSSATPLTFYNSPINFDMPTDFNPASAPRSTNKTLPYSSRFYKANMTAGYFSNLVPQVNAAYRSEISTDGRSATLGYNNSTVAAQNKMLATIEATAKAEGFVLRYPIATYQTFRDAALKYTLQSDDVVDGIKGAHTAPLVWFTNGKDASGAHHPFMMIAAFSVPDTPGYLTDIVKPPGAGEESLATCNNGLGSDTGYPNQCVTRSMAAQNFIWRVPLKDYGLTTSLCDNTMGMSYYSDFYKSVAPNFCSTTAAIPTTIENYASIADSGVMIDGTSMYPVLNNALIPSQDESSLNQHGCHVGKGMGYHCHSDGFSAMNNNMSLYNLPDYASQASNHPPLIGFGFDGVALYGRYDSSFPGMVGYTTSATKPSSTAPVTGNDLDAYGGHTHLLDGKMVYHYHSRPYGAVATGPRGGQSYTVHSLITGAWRGRINEIPDFWDRDKPNTQGRTPSLRD